MLGLVSIERPEILASLLPEPLCVASRDLVRKRL